MDRIVKEGYLYKRSKYLGVSRLRWTVLTHQYLKTYKAKPVSDHQNPTEVFDLMLYDVYTTEPHEISNGFHGFSFNLVSTTSNVIKRVFTAWKLDDLMDWVVNIRAQCLKNDPGIGAIMDIKSPISNPQTVQDEYRMICVCGFIRMYTECNLDYLVCIPEELKQLIMHFVEAINYSKQQQIELKIHSHKGHNRQRTPENMLQSNDDYYLAICR
eukprot:333488_1